MWLQRAAWKDKVMAFSRIKSRLLTACYKRGGVSKPSVPQLCVQQSPGLLPIIATESGEKEIM